MNRSPMKSFLAGAATGALLLYLVPRLVSHPVTPVAVVDSVLRDTASTDRERADLRMQLTLQASRLKGFAARAQRADWESDRLRAVLTGMETAVESLPVALAALESAQAERDTLIDALVAQSALADSVTRAAAAYEGQAEHRIEGLTEALKSIRPALAARSRPWAAGLMLDGVSPNGGYVSRDLFRRANILVAVAGNPAQVLVGVGLRF